MKPLKSISPFSSWMLRIGLLIMVVALVYPVLSNFDISNVNHILSAFLMLFSIMLVIGGFLKNNTLTMISGIVIMLLCGWLAYSYNQFSILNRDFVAFLLSGTIGFHFLANGNK